MKEKKINQILYILSMSISFITQIGDFKFNRVIQLSIGLFWICFGLLQMALNGFSFKNKDTKKIISFMGLYIFPVLLIHFYSIALMIFGVVSWEHWTTNISIYIPTILAVMAIYLFKEKAIKYTFISIFLSWIISIVFTVIFKGISIFPYAIIQGYINPSYRISGYQLNYLELHDLVLGIGYILVYYICCNSKLTKTVLLNCSITLIIMLLGVKKIAVIGILVIILFRWFTSRVSDKRKYKICRTLGILGIICCYIYIFGLGENGFIYDLIDKLGIETMGRIYYYKVIMGYAIFSVTFLGIGKNVVGEILTSEFSYLKVGGVHSDIIKTYVENGFIVFGIWAWYYLRFLVKKYKEICGIKGAYLYFCIIIYTFILYFTDNTEIYFCCQILNIMIPVSYAIYRNK